jgi:hypothetical protein
VVEYLGRYTHKVAISNHRIKKINDDGVAFRWRDYRDNRENDYSGPTSATNSGATSASDSGASSATL